MKRKISSEISELAGIFAADGSMQPDHISFWGNPSADRDFYDTNLKDLIQKSFGIDVTPHEKANNSVYGFYICKKSVINYFHDYLGFPFGSKTYTVAVPYKIVHADLNIQLRFVRGFMAGDGCLNFDKKYAKDQPILRIIHTYPRIQIKSVSKRIIEQLSLILNMARIRNFISLKRSKKSNEVDSYMLQVSGEEMLEKWVKLIGFSNQNHASRYAIFKKHGMVPSYTSYDQRMAILHGKLDIWSFYPKWARSLVWIRRQDKDS